MGSRRREDPTPLLLIAAAVAVLLAASVVHHLRIASLPKLDVPVGIALAASVVIGTSRTLATRRTLRSRTSYAVVPADEFDPSPETVARFAAQLSRLHPRSRGWLDRRASAVRIQLEKDSEGRVVYLLGVPERGRELLRAALRSYDGVDLREPQDLGLPAFEARHVTRAELVLARRSAEPLARLELEPDPLQPFAGALKATHHADRLSVCVDLLPAPGRQRRRLERRLMRAARRGPNEVTLLETARGRRRERTPAQLVERRADTRALDSKLKDAGALFRLQVLVRCASDDASRAKATQRSLLAGFDQLADRNWLRVSGLAIPGAAFLGSDLPLRRRRFDRRVRTGLFRPARSGVVTARELAGFLKPPTVKCEADNVLRSGALVPAAPGLPEFDGQRTLVPIGRIVSEHGSRLAGVRVEDTFFSYVAGRSRYGKTELAVAQFVHLVRSGHGGLFLDPHEDAVARIKRYVASEGVRERVVEINLAGSRAAEAQPAWNLFELGAGGTLATEGKIEAVVDAFASALRWDERNNRAITVTTQAAQALAAVARLLPTDLAPTIFQLPTLLSDDDWRRVALPLLPRASQRFWLDRFPRLSEEAITPVTNLVDRLRASTPITALLGQSRSTYRVRDAMDHGLIVLACPGSGGARDRLVANLLVFDLLHAAKARAEVAPERRRPFFVFLDEVQTYDGASSGNLAALLEQTAKYGVRAFLLNQNPERLTAQTLNAVTTNRSHLLATALNARAASLIGREWGGQVDPAAITRLPRYRFLAQVTHGGELSRPFQLAGVTVDELHGPGDADELVALEHAIDERCGRRPTAEALAHLETLDERILDELKRRRADPSDTPRGPRPKKASGGLTIDAGGREP